MFHQFNQVDLAEDMMISGIVTQGMATNPERRVDEFKIEYEASDDSETQSFDNDMVNLPLKLITSPGVGTVKCG